MFAWFRRNKIKDKVEETPQRVDFKPINFPANIILLWAKSIEGDEEILIWLRDNGYEALFHATNAIYLRDQSRLWLMENGYAHLMAMINGAEGLESAQHWLMQHKMELLYHMALAIDHNDDSWHWLGQNATPDLVILSKSIQYIKDQIEENHGDIHSMGKDL